MGKFQCMYLPITRYFAGEDTCAPCQNLFPQFIDIPFITPLDDGLAIFKGDG